MGLAGLLGLLRLHRQEERAVLIFRLEDLLDHRGTEPLVVHEETEVLVALLGPRRREPLVALLRPTEQGRLVLGRLRRVLGHLRRVLGRLRLVLYITIIGPITHTRIIKDMITV